MDVDRILEIINDESCFIPFDPVPHIDTHHSHEYLCEIVRDAFRDAKASALNGTRHRFDISRYIQTDTEDDIIDDEKIEYLYSHYGTSLTVGAPLDGGHTSSAWKYTEDAEIYQYLCRFFSYRSRFALLICHNLSDVFVIEHMLPVHRIVDMLCSTETCDQSSFF